MTRRGLQLLLAVLGAVAIICAVWFVAACSRVLSILAVGSPHPLFLALMVVEFAIPLVVVPWHAAVSRRGERTRRLEGMT
jgi:hypothetical protein